MNHNAVGLEQQVSNSVLILEFSALLLSCAVYIKLYS